MGITAVSGPGIFYGIAVGSSGNTLEYNEQRGPSLCDLGDGMLDPRMQYGYGYNVAQGVAVGGTSTSGPYTMGFWSNMAVVDYIPGTISTNVITTNTSVVANTALVLTASGINASKVTITAPETGASTTVICIDAPCGGSSNQGVMFGQAGTIQVWNPASVCGRGITINLSSNLDGGTWTIAGRDVYGFKITEQLAAASTMKSNKTYKYISQIVASTTVTSTGAIVGVQDLFGFPLYVNHPAYLNVWIGPSSGAYLVNTSTGGNHTSGSSATATSTTGDVRGTYASTTATSTANAVRLVMQVTPQLQAAPSGAVPGAHANAGFGNITATSWNALFGVAQFSSV